MLIQFNFENFKSFKDETTLDLSATPITEMPSHVAKSGNEKVLKVAAIYGANASGKTNIYEAFEFMQDYVIKSFAFGDENKKARKISDYLKVTPFILDTKSKRKPTVFEVFFIDKNEASERTYQYGFKLFDEEVLEEWLYYKAKTRREYKTIFYRKKDEPIDFSGIKAGAENIKLSLEKEVLIVSLGAKLKIKILKKIRDWFYNHEVVNFGDEFENFLRMSMLPEDFSESRKIQEEVINYFHTFDDSIKDFKIQKENFALPNGETKERLNVYALHEGLDTDDLIPLPLENESSGTLKMFSMYPSIKEVLESGSILFVDELNARLHPLLVRNIILTFANKNTNINNAQLIFTTHDVWQISNEFLRRDEIWFVQKDNGVSELYSLSDFKSEDGVKIRKDEAYLKNYLLGKYRAIPELHPINVFDEEENE